MMLPIENNDTFLLFSMVLIQVMRPVNILVLRVSPNIAKRLIIERILKQFSRFTMR